ncbi:MAG: hypothetical protein QF570_08295 [Myxococcota bacterium]|nr:hypothetical protein [Myxococcota bacterium]
MSLVLALLTVALLGNRCGGGSGSGGSPPRVRVPADECTLFRSEFPAGFDFLPGSDGHAVAIESAPAAAIFLDIEGDVPALLEDDEIQAVPPDSDGDGQSDEDQRLCGADATSKSATLGPPLGVSNHTAFVPSSGFEQVMFFAAPDGRLLEFDVSNPPNPASGDYYGEDYPYLPADEGGRTAVSTKACVYLTPDTGIPDATSTGDAIGQHVCCDRVPGVPSYMTSFTAGMALAAGHLFVATSNLDLPEAYRGRYFPGTLLVYDYDPDVDPRAIQPNTETPLLFTTGFNPTGVSSYTTPRGRELVLVANTGANRVGVGASNILTEAFIDVIDAASRRLVATVPMGLAGLSFDGLAIDPLKRVALVGSWTLRVMYAIDLRVFDDEDLYLGSDIVVLDGSDPVFPDARIFHADAPFEVPDREDGPHPLLCEGWTQAAINAAGDRAYVTDRCDGTLTEMRLLEPTESCAAAGSTDDCCDRIPLPASCFETGLVREITDISTASVEKHDPSQIRVRPGEPGIDYAGPDVFFIVNSPEGRLCNLRVDSF